MNILYLTTAISELEYEIAIKNHRVLTNPSNQRFHNNLIQGLSLINHLFVFSKTRLTKKRYEIVQGIKYFYPTFIVSKNKYTRNFLHEIRRIISDIDLVIVDDQNLFLGRLATTLKTKYKLPIVSIISDHYSYLSNIPKLYPLVFKMNILRRNAYVFTTPALEQTFNKQHRPSISIYASVKEEHVQNSRKIGHTYIYYGGTLLSQYGVNNLIEAFKLLKKDFPDLKLYIAGHQNTLIPQQADIKFLGFLSPNENAYYLKNATLLINPRTNGPVLDKYSIPSKVIDYTLFKKPIISTKNEYLRQFYKDFVIFCDPDIESLKEAIKHGLTLMENQRQYLIDAAYKITIDNFSYKKIGQLINLLLKQIIPSP